MVDGRYGALQGASGFDICFIHPKADETAPIGGQGVLIELVQAPLEVREGLERLTKIVEAN